MAELKNGNFESGRLDNWNVSGDVTVTDSSFGSGPSQGDYQVLLQAGPDLDPDLNRSEMWQTFTVNSGDLLSFDWNFLTDEGTPQWQGYNDKAFMNLHQYDEGGDWHILADTWSSFVNSATTYSQETGFNTFYIDIPNDNTLTIKFGVQTTKDRESASALLIDNVQIRRPVLAPPRGLRIG